MTAANPWDQRPIDTRRDSRQHVTSCRLSFRGTNRLLHTVKASAYQAMETLRDGRRIEVRALGLGDRAGLLDAVGRMSEESLYRRFFAPRRSFTDREIAYFIDVDFVGHVALVAVLEEAGDRLIVAGGRYIVTGAGRAEVAFGVDDAHQGLGIAPLLMRHLIAIARAGGLSELYAEVLPENRPMRRVFEKCGYPVDSTPAAGAVHISIRVG